MISIGKSIITASLALLISQPLLAQEKTFFISGPLDFYSLGSDLLEGGSYTVAITHESSMSAAEEQQAPICSSAGCEVSATKSYADHLIEIVTTIFDSNGEVVAAYSDGDLAAHDLSSGIFHSTDVLDYGSGSGGKDYMIWSYSEPLPDSGSRGLVMQWQSESSDMLASTDYPDPLVALNEPGYWVGSGMNGTQPWVAGGFILDISGESGDSDGDGIPDAEDLCLDSDVNATIVIGDIDTGVENTIFEDGCSISDDINSIINFDITNHGLIAASVSEYTNSLKAGKLITGKEKGKIESAVAKAY